MGDLGEFSLRHRIFLRSYPWRRIDPVPWTPLGKPLDRCRLALASSAGFVLKGQERFDTAKRGGDPSFREIPADAPASSLVDAHRSRTFDHSSMCRDPNLAFPIDRVRELADRGRIGSLSRHHLSFMGSLTATGRLTRTSAPAAARSLVDNGVDVALLVPV